MIFISHTFWCAKIRTVCFDLYWTSYLSHISISACCQKLNLVISRKTKSNSRILFYCFRFKTSQPTLLSPPRGYFWVLGLCILWCGGRCCKTVRFSSVCSLRHKLLVWFSGLPPPGVYWENKYPAGFWSQILVNCLQFCPLSFLWANSYHLQTTLLSFNYF